jgi:hypothetical protein
MGNGGNIAGGGVFSNLNTGALGTDYFLPRDAGTMSNDIPFLAARGVRLIRLPLRWERMTESPGGALQATPVAELHTVLDICEANGVQVILDCHNYANYWLGSDTTTRNLVVLARTGGSLTSAHLSDFWVRMDAEFGAHAAVHSYDLMNESSLGSMVGVNAVTTNIQDFNTDTTGWVADASGGAVLGHTTSSPYAGAGAATFNKAFTTSGFSQGAIRQSLSAGRSQSGTEVGCWVWYPTQTDSAVNIVQTHQARIVLWNSAGSQVPGTTRSITKGQWNYVSASNFTAGELSNHQALGLQIWTTGTTAAETITFKVDEFGMYSTLTAAQVWQQIAADCADALHAEGSTKRVWLSGYGTSEGSLTTFHQSAGPYYTGDHTNYGYAVHNYPDRNEAGADSSWEFGLHSRAALVAGW